MLTTGVYSIMQTSPFCKSYKSYWSLTGLSLLGGGGASTQQLVIYKQQLGIVNLFHRSSALHRPLALVSFVWYIHKQPTWALPVAKRLLQMAMPQHKYLLGDQNKVLDQRHQTHKQAFQQQLPSKLPSMPMTMGMQLI